MSRTQELSVVICYKNVPRFILSAKYEIFISSILVTGRRVGVDVP